MDPEDSSENRDQLSGLVTKQMVRKARNLAGRYGPSLFRALAHVLFLIVRLLQRWDVDLVHL